MKGFGRFLLVFVLSLFCPFFCLEVYAADSDSGIWRIGIYECTIQDSSSDHSSSSSGTYQQRMVPLGTFQEAVSYSTSGYTLSSPLTVDLPIWGTSNSVMFKSILYNGEATGYYQRYVSGASVIANAQVYTPRSFYVPPASSGNDFAFTGWFRISPPDRVLPSGTYDFRYTFYLPEGFSFSSSSPVSCDTFMAVWSDDIFTVTSSSIYLNMLNVQGTCIIAHDYPTGKDIPSLSFTLSGSLPDSATYSISEPYVRKLDTSGFYNFIEFIRSDSDVISDSLTSFPGSADMDASKGQLDGVISDYDAIEGSLFDSGQTAFDQFDPSSLLDFSVGITAAIAQISQLMVGIISAMGEFSVIYTVGVVLVFFGMLIGLWRFFK